MATTIPYKVYQNKSSKDVYDVFPDLSLSPNSEYAASQWQEINYTTLTPEQQAKLVPKFGMQNLQQLEQALSGNAGEFQYLIDAQGRFTTQDVLNREAAGTAGVAAGTQKNIGTATAPLYVPTGSAAQQNYQQNITPNVASGVLNPTGTAPGPNAPIDTSQPSPATVNATPYTSKSFTLPETPVAGYAPQTVFNDKGEPLSYEQFIAQGGKPDFSNVQRVSAIQQGVTAAQQSGKEVPQDPATAKLEVQNFIPATGGIVNTQAIEQTLANDPTYQQLLADRAEYNSIANQTTSLVDTYNEAITAAGIPGINTELLNTQKIIDGTEDDIRKEVQAARGFATESQVLALVNARNKSLIKNYNNLLATKQMAMESINTMIGLAGQDRQFALSNVMQKLQIDEQIASYRDKFISAANEGYNRIVTAVGYDGLVGMLAGDASAIALAEKSLGLPAGGLVGTAQAVKAQKNIELATTAQIKTRYTNNNGEFFDTKTGIGYATPQDFFKAAGVSSFDEAYQKGLVTDLSGVPTEPKKTTSITSDEKKPTISGAASTIKQAWQEQGYIQGNGKISSQDYKEAKQYWIDELGFTAAQFDNQFSSMIDKTGSNWRVDYNYTGI